MEHSCKPVKRHPYAFELISCIAIIILGLSFLTSGLTSSVRAQTTRTYNIRSNPKSSVNFLKRGRDRFQQKDYKGAISDINQAIVLNPYNPNAYYSRGLVLHELGDFLNAVLDFDRALQLNPRYANAYFYREKCSLWYWRGNRNNSGLTASS
ncbi:tetratricopeptide repeat protein [Iningainema tapete]|uniref:Tetratricopeptide repeat protein n=1 Tax=Iningainema tapete BLCC-T55 TaxID=2748662 RepID=A0A8J6XIF4_9CYAN|nr:tetratricopeptide repeat protein [Iningainema tapete]MBD2773860.1 tetratricopeptide repeat protein [Iningainema tapete BLCC-T55]